MVLGKLEKVLASLLQFANPFTPDYCLSSHWLLWVAAELDLSRLLTYTIIAAMAVGWII